MSRTLVVVGNGMVGHRLVEAVRAEDTADGWRVVVLAEEARPAYDRVQLSSYVGSWNPDDLTLDGSSYDGDDAVELRLGDPVVHIDRERQIVRTRAGHRVAYDALVLATGSYPFVPPVPGHELPNCFVYRTIEDLDAIKAAADNARQHRGRAAGAVVGGGLLGLEAAKALRDMGLSPHVIEMAPRLMPIQVDDGGGALLKRLVEQLDVTVHTGTVTEKIEADRDRLIATLGNGTELDLDLLVFSAGIRPRDQLARECGLDVGERGGVITDAQCRTSDPHIYAVGEVAAVEGTCYGLVAPGYTQAEIVAAQLAAGNADASFPGADLSTKLKLMGVDVASFGDAHAKTEGSLEVVVNDAIAGTYKKLVVSDDSKTLLGGILVGDASEYNTLRPMVGSELPGDPVSIISPAGSEGGGGLGVEALPDEAQICSCNNVTKGEILCAVRENGADTVPAIKACTNAGTGCGSCVTMLPKLLKTAGVEVSKALCEHFEQSRAELFEIVRATRITTFSELIAKHGKGSGCAICKPAVASILASIAPSIGADTHILQGEQATLQDTNDKFLANMQKNGTYSVVPRVPGGEITPDKLIVLGEVAKEFGLYTKITGGQRIDLFGATVDQLPHVWKRLVDAGFESGHAYGKALRTVKSCVGSTWCRYGVQDSVGMAVELELRYRGLRSPHKLKSAVSGCARECAEARGKDFGIIATDKGWNLYVCGNGGMTPRHADLLVSDVDSETLIKIIDRFLMFYIRTADRLQRTSNWLEELEGGLEHLKEVVVDDKLGICDELEAAMKGHIENYADEWKGVLDDPEKLACFTSFVNAPEAPDPTISFREEREQKVPVMLGIPEVAAQ